MPPHTVLGDRNRKARIREREQREFNRSIRLLDNITDEQVATLNKIKAAEATGKPVTTASVSDWLALRAMGVVKDQDGTLILTSRGAKFLASLEYAR